MSVTEVKDITHNLASVEKMIEKEARDLRKFKKQVKPFTDIFNAVIQGLAIPKVFTYQIVYGEMQINFRGDESHMVKLFRVMRKLGFNLTGNPPEDDEPNWYGHFENTIDEEDDVVACITIYFGSTVCKRQHKVDSEATPCTRLAQYKSRCTRRFANEGRRDMAIWG